MKKNLQVLAVMAIVLVLVPGAASAEKLFMSSAAAAALKKCDTLHHEQTCDRYHVASDPVPTGEETSTLVLNDREYRVDWSGMAYRLENGTVVSQQNGQWMQVFPSLAPVSGSHEWTDNDGDKALSISDTLTVNGVSSKIKDVRFYLWVEPVR